MLRSFLEGMVIGLALCAMASAVHIVIRLVSQ